MEGIASDCAYFEDRAIELVSERIQKVIQSEATMYQIILLDFSMPGIGGLAVAEKICQLVAEHGIKKPYLCCCTAYDSFEHQEKAKKAGFDQFVTKPVYDTEIREIIAKSKE